MPPAVGDVIQRHLALCRSIGRALVERHLDYNHLAFNYAALAFADMALNAGRQQVALGKAFLQTLRHQVCADGGHAERSGTYHIHVLRLASAMEAMRAGGPDVSREIAGLAEAMRCALPVLMHPDGDIAVFNDAVLGDAGRADWFVSGSTPAAPEKRELPDTGFIRLGQRDTAVIFDVGPGGAEDNPGHAHADFLSIEVSVHGRRLFCDPGVASYAPGPMRDMTRSATWHNGPQVEGFEPMEFWSAFRVARWCRASSIRSDYLPNVCKLEAAGVMPLRPLRKGACARYVGLVPGRSIVIADSWAAQDQDEPMTRFVVGEGWRIHKDGTKLKCTAVDDKSVWTRISIAQGRFTLPRPQSYYPRGPFDVAQGWAFDVRPPISGKSAKRAICVVIELSDDFCMSELDLPNILGPVNRLSMTAATDICRFLQTSN